VLEGEALKSEPWTWLWGEINPRRLVSDQTVEDVRNVAGGEAGGLGSPLVTTMPVDAAKRAP